MFQFYDDKNDSFLLSNSKFIMEGLRKLNEKLTFTELEIYNNIGTDLVIELPLKPIPTNNEGSNGSKSMFLHKEIIWKLKVLRQMGTKEIVKFLV